MREPSWKTPPDSTAHLAKPPPNTPSFCSPQPSLDFSWSDGPPQGQELRRSVDSSTESCAPSSNKRDAGQATVEFALALGGLVVVVALVVQVLAGINDQIGTELMAREGARAASRSADPLGAAQRTIRAIDSEATVGVEIDGQLVIVSVRRASPFIARLTGRENLTATVVMALEPP